MLSLRKKGWTGGRFRDSASIAIPWMSRPLSLCVEVATEVGRASASEISMYGRGPLRSCPLRTNRRQSRKPAIVTMMMPRTLASPITVALVCGSGISSAPLLTVELLALGAKVDWDSVNAAHASIVFREYGNCSLVVV
jgi:hypothetical protein